MLIQYEGDLKREDFVYIINADHTVIAKTVVMGPASADDTVIKSGLLPGQNVVVNGADKLLNGSKGFVQTEHSSSTPVKKASNDSRLRSVT